MIRGEWKPAEDPPGPVREARRPASEEDVTMTEVIDQDPPPPADSGPRRPRPGDGRPTRPGRQR